MFYFYLGVQGVSFPAIISNKANIFFNGYSIGNRKMNRHVLHTRGVSIYVDMARYRLVQNDTYLPIFL